MAKSDDRAQSVWWPAVNDTDDARSAAKQGVWYALFFGTGTAVIATLNLAGVTNNLLGLDAYAYGDAAVFLALAFFINRMSRIAAVLALAFYIAERLAQVLSGQIYGGGIAVIFLGLFFVNAVRGTFAYHRLVAPASN